MWRLQVTVIRHHSSAFDVEKALQKAERQEGKKHATLYRPSLMLMLVPVLVLAPSMHINMLSSSPPLLSPSSGHIPFDASKPKVFVDCAQGNLHRCT